MLIAIDGRSGSGKSSTARAVAQRLGLAYLDTGSMYRAVTCAQLDEGVGPDDAVGIARVAADAVLVIGTDPRRPTIAVNGRDVTREIREPRISSAVSQGATNLDVRRTLTRQMRTQIDIANRNMVVEGRDITTVVAPDADLRILLLADPRARMARRGAELGGAVDEAALADQIVRRDADDSTVSEFMQAAPGVTVIDSTSMTLDEVVEQISRLAAEHE